MNEAGLALLKKFEDCRLEAYQDGGGVWTIGYGHTGPDVYEGLTCTQNQADAWLVEDIEDVQGNLDHMLTAPVTENQYAALVSLSYNIGVGALHKSTLLRYINDGDTGRAANEFPRWCHDGGKEIMGLKYRRAAERALFETPDSAIA